MASGATRRRSETLLVTTVTDGAARRRPDELIVEEPMTVQLDGTVVNTTMRTPGNDYELAVGFCFTEGLLAGAGVTGVRYCANGSAVEAQFNVVTVETAGRAPTPTPRLGTTTSSCGICGTESIDALAERLVPLSATPAIELDVLRAVPDRVRAAQGLFDTTGAVHAAAAFDQRGEVLLVREDVGRHNAVDKIVGRLLLEGALPATGLGLFVSGRASFELVQKAWAAGFGTLLAVSAPTALAVHTARRAGLTLAGFVRADRLNIYAPERPQSGVARSLGTMSDSAKPAIVGPSTGLGVLHLFCKPTPMFEPEAVVAAVKTAEGAGCQVATVAMLGHKCDLAVMAMHADTRELRILQTALQHAGLEVVDSYVSVTEVSEYAKGMPEQMLNARLYPSIPPRFDDGAYAGTEMNAWCFYPMSKRREGHANWFTLEYERRNELMREHGTSGRKFAGRVVQYITGSAGLDDYEWGVTLFGVHTDDLKEVVYTMRFDEASSIYAEFGPFYTGIVTPVEELVRAI